VATMASVGGVLLQHKLSFIAAIDSIQGGLWMGAPIPTHLHVGQGLPTGGSQQLMERDEFICQVRERLKQAQNHYKLWYDRNHRELEFHLEDWVWL
jgi:hypothetical protein